MDRHELSELLGCEQRVAYEVLRITLHTVRDRLSARLATICTAASRPLLGGMGPDENPRALCLRDLATSLRAALPLIAASDGDVFAKIMTLFETRRGHKKSTNLALALKLCATSAQKSDPPALFLRRANLSRHS